jgi:hypothetical protein
MEQFESEYSKLKQEYETALNAAIVEPDQARQMVLLNQILTINQEMVDLIHRFLSSKRRVNTTRIHELTRDLIKYQEDRYEIENNDKKVRAMKLILNKTNENINSIIYKYYLYIGTLIFLCFVVIFLILKSSYKTAILGGGKLVLTSFS